MKLQRIADTIGVSVTETIRAGRLGYARSYLPMPGPVGGPCLEKDLVILASRSKEIRAFAGDHYGGAAH